MNEIEKRRSIRKYINKPVEDEKINNLIESARQFEACTLAMLTCFLAII
ncbi:hypothetical protein DESME_03615 [Desulfitobacterium metallireducens DSM 15288]|uniref:Nitroreductase domain-containing protein n=1 Tax=Desulfitobacterium metallireducens DSM 15288 TaxID=871968 RepID=W0EGX4_9FIRM|nr:hypothetical protein DESME_03615 [Desulfitobacterium metallireducens DSM 15288]